MNAFASFWIDFGSRVTVSLPAAVTRFICDFDTGKDVKPFRFELSLELAVPYV